MTTNQKMPKRRVRAKEKPLHAEQHTVDITVLEKQACRLNNVVSTIGIVGLLSRISIDTTGKVPTACWSFNEKNKEFAIKVGYEFIQTLTDDEIRIVLEHELLHHVRYRSCDIRNPLMSNIVLDVAINKTLYLYNKHVINSLFNKIDAEAKKTIGNSLEDAIVAGSPGLLVYPTLDARQIERISDDKVREAYIEIWGNRRTPADFNCEIPSPLTLYYKLVEFVPLDTDAMNPFGEDVEDNPQEGESSDGEAQTSQKQQEKGSRGGGGKKRQRARVEEESRDDSSKKASHNKDDQGIGDKKKEEASSSKEDKEDNKKEEGESKDADQKEEIESYSDILESAEDLANEVETAVKGQSWGNVGGSITLKKHHPPDINSAALKEILAQRIFEQTVDEIGTVIAETVGSTAVRQIFPTHPTRATLTYMACGITDYLPFFFNKVHGEAKPMIMPYIDISSSMAQNIPLVSAIMSNIAEYLPSVCHLFDTEIMPFPTQAWSEVRADGGGTNFDVVIEHILSNPNNRLAWFEKWMQKHSRQLSKTTKGDVSTFGMIAKYGIDSIVANEDYPTILWVTDGACDISALNIKRFQESGKQLIVLMLSSSDYYGGWSTSGHSRENAFKDIFRVIYYLNPRGEIIDKQGA